MSRGVRNTAESFWDRVVKGEGCWLWPQPSGRYGTFAINGESVSAHKFAWISTQGFIPRGLFVLHKCDRPKCVRPDHLFLGTHQDNMDDRRVKGRTASGMVKGRRGEQSGRSKLSEVDVLRIREARLFGAKQPDLARAYGVASSQVSNIIRNKSRKYDGHVRTN